MSPLPVKESAIHIALVIHALHGGGAERLMSQLAARWSEQGHQISLVTLAKADTDQYAVPQSVRRIGLDLMRPSRNALDGWRANQLRVSALRETLQQLQPQFILSFCDRMNIVTCDATRGSAVPTWIAEHSDPDRQRLGWLWEWWRSRAYRALGKRAHSGCVVLDEDIARRMQRRFPSLPVVVIPPSIASVPVERSPRETVAETDPRKYLLSIGRHSSEKNLQALIRAWSRVAGQFKDWQLLMVGDGPEHTRLIALAQELGVGDRVQFIGWSDRPDEWYRKSSLLVLTSLYEGVPVVLLEAMSHGLPCIATPACETISMFAQRNAIGLIASSSVDDIQAALEKWLSNPGGREAIAKAALPLVARYTWDVIGPRWDAILRGQPLA